MNPCGVVWQSVWRCLAKAITLSGEVMANVENFRGVMLGKSVLWENALISVGVAQVFFGGTKRT